MMLMRMFPDHPEFARERRLVSGFVALALFAAIVAVAVPMLRVLS